MPSDQRGPVTTLRSSQEHLAKIVGALSDEQVAAPSYCSDWSVAQVLSHLGSGAEIAKLGLDAARRGAAAPEREEYQKIWDRWNAKSPRQMADDALATNEAHIATLEQMSEEELAGLQMPFFGGRILDGAGAAQMRLSEHAVHSWDVEVTGDPAAALQPTAVERLIDLMPERAARLGRGEKPSGAIAIHTTAPTRDFLLSFGEEAALTAGSGDATSRLSLPAEALIRLLYGRLDAAHTPAGIEQSGPIGLDELRAAFPGF